MEPEKKAYDLKALGEKCKSQGLELAEESLKLLVGCTFEWLDESADLSKNPYDNMAKVLYPQLKKMALQEADKINPADNA